MEELFLRALLLREELDVVDEQHIDRAELVAEAGHLVVAQRVDHLVSELLDRDVADGGELGWRSFTSWPMACIRCVLPMPTPP